MNTVLYCIFVLVFLLVLAGTVFLGHAAYLLISNGGYRQGIAATLVAVMAIGFLWLFAKYLLVRRRNGS